MGNDDKNVRKKTIKFLMFSYFGDWTVDPLYAAILRAYRDATMRATFVPPEKVKEKKDSFEVCGIEIIRYAVMQSIEGLESFSHKLKDINLADSLSDMSLRDLKVEKHGLGTSWDEYTRWHHELCDKLVDFYRAGCKKTLGCDQRKQYFSYGNAQKWVNMTMKYLYYMSSLLRDNGDYKPWCQKIIDISKNFHIPLDSYMLTVIKEELNIDPSEIGSTAWSKISDYDKYMNYQNKVREELKGDSGTEHMSPIDWENDHWIEQAKAKKMNDFSLKKFYVQ